MFDRKKLRQALRLYAVTGPDRGERLAGAVEQALLGGATMVQLRDKRADDREFCAQAFPLKRLAERFGVPLILNDRVHLVGACGADGVHLGQRDGSPQKAREALGPEKIIGVSAHSVEEALRAEREGADYLGVGAVFGSATKTDAVPTTPETVRAICAAVRIPVVAIGGIGEGNLPRLAGCGLAGAAVVSALFSHKDVRAAASRLRALSDRMAAG